MYYIVLHLVRSEFRPSSAVPVSSEFLMNEYDLLLNKHVLLGDAIYLKRKKTLARFLAHFVGGGGKRFSAKGIRNYCWGVENLWLGCRN